VWRDLCPRRPANTRGFGQPPCESREREKRRDWLNESPIRQEGWLTQKVWRISEQRVLAVWEDVMIKSWLLAEEGREARHTFSQPDLIIAATAAHHGLTTVTRDTGDYQRDAQSLCAAAAVGYGRER
jgi:predicted nucleic acid-binding protein